jgi:methionine sulfoxide reductase heme-binding subunit
MDWLSTWNVIRASGLTSYLLLFLSVSLGMFCYGKWIEPKYRSVLLIMHHLFGWTGFLFGMLHGLVLMIDNYQPFSFKMVLIPFTAQYLPLASGLGTISLYLMVAVLISSDWMKTFGRKVWRFIHYLALPSYLLALIHGIAAGTDTGSLWARLLYLLTAAAFLICLTVRIQYRLGENQTKTPGF